MMIMGMEKVKKQLRNNVCAGVYRISLLVLI